MALKFEECGEIIKYVLSNKGNPMSNHQKPKKKHHYVPRMYLEGFCDVDGMVWTYSKNNPNNPYPQKPDNVAIEKFFYSLYGKGVDPDAFEDALADIVETPAASSLQSLRAGEPPTFDDRQLLSLFFGFMLVRTPRYRGHSDNQINKDLALWMKALANDKEGFNESVEKYNKESGLSPIDNPEVLRGDILSGRCKPDVHPNYSLYVIQSLGCKVSQLLPSMKWSIIKSPLKKCFITSDNPILLYNARIVSGLFTPGLAIIGTKVFVPVSKSIGLIMTREENITFETQVVDDNGSFVDEMNSKVIAHAYENIYSSESGLDLKKIISSDKN